MSKKRTQYKPEFKAKVALAALRNEETVSQLSTGFGIHPTMINNWKRALLDDAADILDKGQKSRKQNKAQDEFKFTSAKDLRDPTILPRLPSPFLPHIPTPVSSLLLLNAFLMRDPL